MRLHKHLLFVCCLLVMAAGQAQQDANAARESLQIIAEFANTMCANPAYQGSSTSVGANASAKAELSNLLRKLSDAKIELGSEVRGASFQGLLQTDLLEATKAASQCRLKIYDDLKSRLLPNAGGSPGEPRSLPLIAPSFDCVRASNRAERLICSSGEIAVLDLAMANAYRDVMAEQRTSDDRSRWRNDQNHWLRQVRDQCSTERCLNEAYVLRIDQLKQARR